ncbi:MAG: hypothetical protein IT207_08785 [Fimbriimonadaceae bacterium]|nr:hypothetical protein [Fimbriimonadaceae bacterium]
MISALLAFVASPSGPDGLGAPSLLLDQGKLLSVTEGHADLAMYDLDGDGAKDMIVGQFKDGLVRFYKNHAEKGSPKFEGFEYLKAAGAEIKIDAG